MLASYGLASADAPRIAFLAIDYPPSVGGIQLYLEGVVSAVREWSPRVLAPGAALTDDPAEVERIGTAGSSPLARAGLNLALARAAARRPPDLVVCGHVLALPAGVVTARRFKVPLVCITYGGELRAPRSRWLTQRLLKRCDGVIAISRFTVSEVAHLGVDHLRIRMLQPAIDVAEIAAPPTGALEQMGLRTPYLLSLGRLDDFHKGHDVALRALARLRDRAQDLHYVIAGDGPARRALEGLADTLDLRDRVRFMGQVTNTEKQVLLGSAKALVLLSREDKRGRFEGFGIVVLEAALAGVPALVGRSGGLTDAVVEGETGYTVDPLDVSAVAAAMERLAEPQVSRRLGTQAQARVQAEFALQTRAFEVRRVLSEFAIARAR